MSQEEDPFKRGPERRGSRTPSSRDRLPNPTVLLATTGLAAAGLIGIVHYWETAFPPSSPYLLAKATPITSVRPDLVIKGDGTNSENPTRRSNDIVVGGTTGENEVMSTPTPVSRDSLVSQNSLTNRQTVDPSLNRGTELKIP